MAKSRQAKEVQDLLQQIEELKKNNLRLNTILNSIQDDFYVLDHEWKFVHTSKQITSRIGNKPEDFLSRIKSEPGKGSSFCFSIPKYDKN